MFHILLDAFFHQHLGIFRILAGNYLSDVTPGSLNALQSLTYLDLTNNMLTTVPSLALGKLLDVYVSSFDRCDTAPE